MFSRDVLAIDTARTAAQIEETIRYQVSSVLRRRGAVIGVSGGIDSAVVAVLCARALGAARVQVLLMPERDSSSDALRLGRLVASTWGVPAHVEDIAPTLAALGCYASQIAAVRTMFPDYDDGYRCRSPFRRFSTATASTFSS